MPKFFFFNVRNTPNTITTNGQWFRAMCWLLIGLQNDQIQINFLKKKTIYYEEEKMMMFDINY